MSYARHEHVRRPRRCLYADCGRQRHAGLPVCGDHWRATPDDLQERVRWARGEEPEVKRAAWAAVVAHLEEQAGSEIGHHEHEVAHRG